MEYYRRISKVRPAPDETIMSFLRRTQVDAGLSDHELHLLAASVVLPDARRAERRHFDWGSLSRFFNATPGELQAMSERSFYCGPEDDGGSRLFARRTPWVQESGYSAHCPTCLRQSSHWRKSWLNPDALVCEEHGTLLIRHCHGCGGDLASLVWTSVSPICPNCGAHLSLGPVIAAPPEIARHAAGIRARFAQVLATRPLDQHDYGLAHFAAVWRAARLLASRWDHRLHPLRDEMISLAGVGPLARDGNVSDKALRYAQIMIIAHLISELDPTFSEFYWASTTANHRLNQADQVIYFKLIEFAESLGVELPPGPPVYGQTMMSFASWEGANSLSIAA
jgi:hypothetical protein